jgi:hypothetical protein
MKQVIIIALALSFGFASQPEKTAPKPKKLIFLLLGQSNMAGRGVVSEEYKALKHPRVMMLDQAGEWVLAQHPIHFDKPKVAGVGPGYSFGTTIADIFPSDTIYLVPCAVGGTSISKWEPGAYDKSTDTHPYDDAVARIKQALAVGKITGAIWLQGESDSNPKSATAYLVKLTTLISRIRTESNNPKLPFIVGELGKYRDNYKLINDQLHLLSTMTKFTGLVTSENLTHKGDTTHFDSPSATAYGKRFGKEMLGLLKK